MVNGNLPNTPNPRPPKNRSQAYAGDRPPSVLAHWARKFQPLPAPIGQPPYRYNLETALPGINQIAGEAGKIVFQTVGDTGPYITGEYLAPVAKAMAADLNKPTSQRPAFFYHLGDLVYNNGRYTDYYDQFYKPYKHYAAPIFSIPGNHDADAADANQLALDGWVACFMTHEPHIDPISKDAPRPTMSLANVYYTLECPFVTIIGLYTNVPEHGVILPAQQEWFTNELLAAPTDKALIVCLHNPVYSFDNQHSGSPLMAEALEKAINTSRRVPNLVLQAHVHNYQRIEKKIAKVIPTPFLVAGNGGYYILHTVIAEEGAVDELTGAKLIKGQDRNHGYVEITVDGQNITGKSIVIETVTGEPVIFDSFKYPAGAVFLEEGLVVKL
jgi:hypothetical protein